MDALNSLGRDHRLIARVLDAFDTYVGYIEARLPVERFDLLKFIAFFQDYGDLYHHVKEESLLFPALVAAGASWDDDPMARARSEHDQEHYLLSSLDHSALYGESWSENDRLHFLSIAKEFLSFQRNHMRFENTELFPLAERSLSEFARARLERDAERFDEASRSQVLSSTAIAELLTRRYTLNRPSACESGNRVQEFEGRH